MVFASVVDAIVVGIEIDHPDLFTRNGWILVAAVFNILFTAELVVRVGAKGLGVLKTVQGYTLTLVVALCWLELALIGVIEHIWDPGESRRVILQVPSSMLQVLRILRAVRLAATASDCSMLMNSIVLALPELFWVLVLVVLVFFLAAMAATLFIGRSLDTSGASRQTRANFGYVGDSLFTLLQLALLEAWPDIVRPVLEEHWEWVPAMLGFIALANFGLLKLLTAVVVERTREARKMEAEAQEKLRKAEQTRILRKLHHQLEEFSDGTGTISRERFKHFFSHRTESREALEELGLSKNYMLSTFTFCDVEHKGEVQLGSLLEVWQDSREPLTMANCVRFRHSVISRMEQLEQMNGLVVRAVTQLAQMKAEKGLVPGPAEQLDPGSLDDDAFYHGSYDGSIQPQ